jgi:hypothetical protein
MVMWGLQEEVLLVTTGAAAPGSDQFLLVAEAEEVLVLLEAVAGPWGQVQVGQQVAGAGWAALHLLGGAGAGPAPAAAAVGGVLQHQQGGCGPHQHQQQVVVVVVPVVGLVGLVSLQRLQGHRQGTWVAAASPPAAASHH